MKKIAFLLLAPLWFSALTACAAHTGQTGTAASAATPVEASAPAPQAAAGQGSDTLAHIDALIGTPSCSADRQCKVLALGARPCGGPESYLAYSTARTPEAELQALAQVYQAERHAANTRSGMVSTCLARPEPAAVCQLGTCTLGAPASAPVAR